MHVTWEGWEGGGRVEEGKGRGGGGEGEGVEEGRRGGVGGTPPLRKVYI